MRKIMVEVEVPSVDDHGKVIMREDEFGEKIVVKELRTGYLHHWGLQFEVWTDSERIQHVGQYTVAIVEDQQTGRIFTFMPTEVKVLGSTTYE